MSLELERFITRAVQLATGIDGAVPRPGQLRLTQDIFETFGKRKRMCGIAPTGTGKSLAHMCPAALASLKGERTLISTDSLALQSQFIHKDLPVVADAFDEIYGRTLRFETLKGVSNYIDPVKLHEAASKFTDPSGQLSFEELLERFCAKNYISSIVNDRADFEQFSALIKWGLESYLNPECPGDTDSCPVEFSASQWAELSATSAEISYKEHHGVYPKAGVAREACKQADIIVTNHTLLAIQAAHKIPTIHAFGRLGVFHHIIVDEAHTLPAKVRDQGAFTISQDTIGRSLKRFEKVVEDGPFSTAGNELAEQVDRACYDYGDTRLTLEDADPLGGLASDLREWANQGVEKIAKAAKTLQASPAAVARAKRAANGFEQLLNALDSISTPNPNVARWVQTTPEPSCQSSPVDVSGLLAANVWSYPEMTEGTLRAYQEAEKTHRNNYVESDTVRPPSVTLVSATLPHGYHHQVSVDTEASEYESPFADAYKNSALFIPAVKTREDISALKRESVSRLTFDTFRHEAWCVDQIVELVKANDGSALVLAAKASSGRLYAQQLRSSLPHLRVYSQWDERPLHATVKMWREDVGSVLVGTRSLMTGVDAPGETNSLVIIDRPPRSPQNVIDEARKEKLIEAGVNKWVADSRIYAADAALLLEQSVGRLIRSINDVGMVAVLDPRLLHPSRSKFSYPNTVRSLYAKSLRPFGEKIDSLEEAVAWLKRRRSSSRKD